jgi:predicted ATPase
VEKNVAGAEMAVSTFQALLAEIYQKAGKSKEGLAAVEDGLSIAARINDRHYDAELYRLKGELLLNLRNNRFRKDKLLKAEKCLRRAVEIAHKQKAKSLELKAVMSLCRLWQKTGKEKEAKRLLAKIYGWFIEGFDTPDLKAAKELLDQLS